MNTVISFVLAAALFSCISASCLRDPCVYRQLPSCPAYDVISGMVTCPVSCPNLCSCTGTSALCSCGTPSCSCFLDTDSVCQSCAPQPSPICSCLASLDLNCNCEAQKSFVYFPDVQYPLTVLEMNPFFYSTCFSS